ncbi:hypothetical protein ACFL6X_03665 [Candidatus Latescibacterota bacterium]
MRYMQPYTTPIERTNTRLPEHGPQQLAPAITDSDGHVAMPREAQGPNPPKPEGSRRSPPLGERLKEIRRRVADGFYEADPVLKEVAEAMIEKRGRNRARSQK